MKGLLKLIPMFALTVVGCQKVTTTELKDGVDAKLSALNCQSGTDGVTVSEAGIRGLESLKSGQVAGLSLGSEVNCDAAQKASWVIGSKVLGTGGQIAARINGTGIYYVTV